MHLSAIVSRFSPKFLAIVAKRESDKSFTAPEYLFSVDLNETTKKHHSVVTKKLKKSMTDTSNEEEYHHNLATYLKVAGWSGQNLVLLISGGCV